MRCGRAQKLLTAAVDAELAPRQRQALDRHLAGCEACRAELASTEGILAALTALPMEAVVSPGLEQATLRRVRIAAAEAEERAASATWRRWLPLPAFAVASAAVAVLAFGILTRTDEPPAPARIASAPAGAREEKAPPPAPERMASRTPPAEPRAVPAPPPEPPADLVAAPEKFVNLPILRNLEKLEHFDAIQTTTLDDQPGPPGEEQPSNG